ncbi:MAG: hypothetical protein F6K47_02080 [Symploca sp. SIO2E6]|nr:hypothetical protein [Symploca sp. SIO2E6]
MEYICTTCSKDKRTDEVLLPASQRYISRRIKFVVNESIRLNKPLIILSGKYGLIDSELKIPWYDQKLTTDLLFIASELKPDLVTPPEVLGDGDSTLNLTNEFIKAFEHSELYPETKILGVVHGADFKSWRHAFQELLQIPYISRIGVPYRIPFDIFTQTGGNNNTLEIFIKRRIDICNWLAEHYPTVKIHLFGLAHPSELLYQIEHKFIKSIDTSLPIMAAIKDINYKISNLGPYEKKSLDINSPYNKLVIQQATNNIDVIKSILK